MDANDINQIWGITVKGEGDLIESLLGIEQN